MRANEKICKICIDLGSLLAHENIKMADQLGELRWPKASILALTDSALSNRFLRII